MRQTGFNEIFDLANQFIIAGVKFDYLGFETFIYVLRGASLMARIQSFEVCFNSHCIAD